jgi:hypothetical protein
MNQYPEKSVQQIATHRDRIPVLVHHHHAEKHAQREEKQPIDIMLDRVADSDAEREQEDLCDGEEGGAENDVTDRPAVVEGAEDEDELGNDVDDGADEGPEDVDNPQAGRVGVVEAGEFLKGGYCYEE